MKYIKDYTNSLKGKRILLRIDVNEPVDDKGCPQDFFRIKKSLETISFLQKAEAKIILIALSILNSILCNTSLFWVCQNSNTFYLQDLHQNESPKTQNLFRLPFWILLL